MVKGFFIAVDNAFGQQMQRDMSRAIEQAGGKVVGGVRHPIGTADYSSFLLQAQGSKAKVIALANAGNDTANTVKQGAEFGIRKAGQEFAGSVAAREVRAIGLPAAQGMMAPVSWYWDLDDESRAFAKRFFAKRGVMPSEFQAGAYSAVLHYLKAVQASGTDEAKAVVRKMKHSPVKDFFAPAQFLDLTDDEKLSRRGIFGLQLHAGGGQEVRYKDMRLEVLPKK